MHSCDRRPQNTSSILSHCNLIKGPCSCATYRGANACACLSALDRSSQSCTGTVSDEHHPSSVEPLFGPWFLRTCHYSGQSQCSLTFLNGDASRLRMTSPAMLTLPSRCFPRQPTRTFAAQQVLRFLMFLLVPSWSCSVVAVAAIAGILP